MTEVSVLQTRLSKLKAARDSGVLSVSDQGVSTTFRSLSEMERVIASLQREIDAAGGTVTRRTYGAYMRGKGL